MSTSVLCWWIFLLSCQVSFLRWLWDTWSMVKLPPSLTWAGTGHVGRCTLQWRIWIKSAVMCFTHAMLHHIVFFDLLCLSSWQCSSTRPTINHFSQSPICLFRMYYQQCWGGKWAYLVSRLSETLLMVFSCSTACAWVVNTDSCSCLQTSVHWTGSLCEVVPSLSQFKTYSPVCSTTTYCATAEVCTLADIARIGLGLRRTPAGCHSLMS